MNKKLNTLLFILGATLFNIIVAILGFFVFTLLYARLLIPRMPEANHQWGFTLIFLASIVVSFLTYRAVLKYLLNKVDIEKYFDPIFVRKNLKKPK